MPVSFVGLQFFQRVVIIRWLSARLQLKAQHIRYINIALRNVWLFSPCLPVEINSDDYEHEKIMYNDLELWIKCREYLWAQRWKSSSLKRIKNSV